MEIRDGYCDYIPVYTDDSQDGNAVACATVFPLKTIISMRLTDSASVFTAEVWAIIKALEQIKDSIASKYIVFTDSLLCLQALHNMKLEHPLSFLILPKRSLFFVGYPAILALRAMKRHSMLPSLHWICLVPRLVYPIMILNTVSANIFYPLGKHDWNGAVANKLHSVKPVLGDWQSSYRRCRKDEVVLCRACMVIHI